MRLIFLIPIFHVLTLAMMLRRLHILFNPFSTRSTEQSEEVSKEDFITKKKQEKVVALTVTAPVPITTTARTTYTTSAATTTPTKKKKKKKKEVKGKRDLVELSEAIDLGGGYGKYAGGILVPTNLYIPSPSVFTTESKRKEELESTPEEILESMIYSLVPQPSKSLSLSSSQPSCHSAMHTWLDKIYYKDDYGIKEAYMKDFWTFILNSLKTVHTFVYRLGVFIYNCPNYKPLRNFVDSLGYDEKLMAVYQFRFLSHPYSHRDPDEYIEESPRHDRSDSIGSIASPTGGESSIMDDDSIILSFSIGDLNIIDYFDKQRMGKIGSSSLLSSEPSESMIRGSSVVVDKTLTEFLDRIQNFVRTSRFDTWPDEMCRSELNFFDFKEYVKNLKKGSNNIAERERLLHQLAQRMLYSLGVYRDRELNPFLSKAFSQLNVDIVFDVLKFLLLAIKKGSSTETGSEYNGIIADHFIKSPLHKGDKLKDLLVLMVTIDENLEKKFLESYFKHCSKILSFTGLIERHEERLSDHKGSIGDNTLHIRPLTAVGTTEYEKGIFNSSISKFGKTIYGSILRGSIQKGDKFYFNIISGFELIVIRIIKGGEKILDCTNGFKLEDGDVIIVCHSGQIKRQESRRESSFSKTKKVFLTLYDLAQKDVVKIKGDSLDKLNPSTDIPLNRLAYFYYFHDWPFVGLIQKDKFEDGDWNFL